MQKKRIKAKEKKHFWSTRNIIILVCVIVGIFILVFLAFYLEKPECDDCGGFPVRHSSLEITEVNLENNTMTLKKFDSLHPFDSLKAVFYTSSSFYTKNISSYKKISSLGLLEETQIDITPDSSWGIITKDLTKIEIYAVVVTPDGKEVFSSSPVDVWENPDSGLY
jgi:hypothetical protein